MLAHDSILQRPVNLPNLIEGDAFGEVLRAFADFFKVGVRVYDDSGALLAEARGPGAGACRRVQEGGETCALAQAAGLAVDTSARDRAAAGVTVQCPGGCQVLLAPVFYDGDLMGRVVYGPFVDPDGPGPRNGSASLAEVPRVSEADVRRQAGILGRVLDVLLFSSYKSLLTSNMHIEAITESFRELEEKNEKLRISYERLKELDRLKSNFLATMSHELRTPLTSVIGYSELLLSGMAGDLNEEQIDYVKTIMEKGESLLQMINGVLDISKIESGTLTLNRSRVRMEDVVRSAVSTILPMAQRKRLDVRVELLPELPVVIGDREKLGQVMNNLLTNAIKFTAEEGAITVVAGLCVEPVEERRDEGDESPFAALAASERTCVQVDVADTGIGIPADKLERVFDTFYQVDSSSTREYGGAGLGLAICRNFVKAHAGRIWAASELGKGSTFSFSVPTAAEDE
jgi:signal transduction histidine kinase